MNSRTDWNSDLDGRRLAEAAKERLRKTPYLAVRNVSCECDRGVLFLRGRLPTFYQKQLTQEAVAGLTGVTQVVNETEVVAPPT
jgi:osmotically-inducible protein OsmY